MDVNSSGLCIPRYVTCFVGMALSLLLGLNAYSYLWGHPLTDSLDGDFSDIKYVVTQLTRGLYEVNRKHERLQSELERITAALPAVTVAALRAKVLLEPTFRSSVNPQALSVHDYDQQMTDFALESAGGRVVDTGETVEHVIVDSKVSWMLQTLATWLCRGCEGARTLIQPGSLPGQCWSFRGGRGEATVQLLGSVQVSAVSIEHIAAHISPTGEISSAPRLFQIEGLETRSDQSPHDFGTFEYMEDGKQIQYFVMKYPSTKPYYLIRLRILSNWGHPVYTCVYRLRVHGDLAPGQVMPRITETGDSPPQIDVKDFEEDEQA